MIFVSQNGEEIGRIEGDEIHTKDVQLDSLFYQLIDEGVPQERRPGSISYQSATPDRVVAYLKEQGYEARNGETQSQALDCDESRKLTHKEVKYESPADGPDLCVNCVRYSEPGACQIVQSPIAGNGWCKEFKQGPRVDVTDEPALEYKGMEFQGLKLNIENLRGSVRHGETFHQRMTAPYGYIARTEGADGDAVDCFVGPVLDAPWAYVIHTRDRRTGDYDEDKVMLGFESAVAAQACFFENYDDPYFFDSMEKFTITDFKYKLKALRGKKISA